MCGIAGFILNKENSFVDAKTIKIMTRELSKRGPDGEGYWKSDDGLKHLGHRRLKIIDLSDKASQPMISNNGRFIITYNGEVYNHKELRKNIDKHFNYTWKTNSDTETILSSLENYGFEKTINSLQGMFAFGVIDKLKDKLYLVRDPSGEKPLYYGYVDQNFLFSSELKSIVKFPLFKKKINMEALEHYLNFSFVPEPLSIFDGINKLEKNTYLILDLHSKKIESINNYKTNNNSIIELSNNNYIKTLDELLNKAVSMSLISDVEVGSFLSGGTDSSLVTAIMSLNSNQKIKTFSVGMDDKNYDETFYSRSISKYLGTDHNEIIITEKDLLSQTKEITEIYDEPFSDSSQIPTSMISKFASQKVKVILSGDGADEFFGGYNRYIGIQKLEKLMKLLPFRLRKIIANILSLMSLSTLSLFSNLIIKITNSKISINQIQEKIFKLCAILNNCKNKNELYLFILKNYQSNEENVIKDGLSNYQNLNDKIESMIDKKKDAVSNMMNIDQNFYLQNDILQKVDRASMHYGLETRVPFLNQNIRNFASNIPMNLKIKNGEGKWILKEILKQYIPEKFVNRPKMGFSIPIDLWFRGSLKKWSNDILDINRINQQGLLNSEKIQKKLNLHLNNKRNYGNQIWNLIVLQKWLDKYYL